MYRSCTPPRIFGFMAEYGDIRTGRHRVFILNVHLVFVTKYRHKVFGSAHLEPMKEIMRDVCADFHAKLAEFNGEPGHVHLLVNFPPTVAISRLVNSLKGGVLPPAAAGIPGPAAALLAGETPLVRVVLRGTAGGAPISVPRHYIEQQNRPVRSAHPRPPTPPAQRPAQ